MATFKSDESYKNIKELSDVRTTLARLDSLLKYMFSNLSVNENFTSTGISEYAEIKQAIENLDARVSALEGR